jgi:uncharacterized protein (TIGR00369 family)
MSAIDAASIQAALDDCPAIATLGMVVESCEPSIPSLTLTMPLSDAARRAAGGDQFHGGAIASLIDTAGDFAVALSSGGGVPTVNLRVDYLRPAAGAALRAVATARRIGRTIACIDVDVLDPAGRVCAIGRATYLTATG